MCKKLFCTVIILITLFIFALPVMAKPTEGMLGDDLILTDPTIMDSSNQDALSQNVICQDLIGSAKDIELRKLLDDIIRSTDTKETEQILATFTKPEMGITKETIFTQLYIVLGYAEQENLGLIIARYNEKTCEYEEYGNFQESKESMLIAESNENEKDEKGNDDNKDNESKTEIEIGIDICGFFSKEIKLEKGLNKLKLIIFKKPPINNSNDAGALYDSYLQDLNNLEEFRNSSDMISKNTEITLEAGKNLQINFFTINVLDENTKNSLINSPAKIENVFEKKNIFDRISNVK